MIPPAIGLDLSRGGALARVSIRVPPVNVLNGPALHELARRVGEAGEARVLVVSGLPSAFSAGVDVAEHVPEPDAIEAMLAAMRAALTAFVESRAVTIACVSGACLGGGAEIAAVCDLVLLSEDARVGFPEIRLACFPPGAAAFLSGRIGEARAAEWILTGTVFSGREAADVGFASRAVPPALLARETDRLAKALLARGPAALSAARELLRAGRRGALERGLPRAEEAYRKLAGNEDLARAVSEFMKR